MPRIELNEDQKAEAAVLAEKVARIMEEKPPARWTNGVDYRGFWWILRFPDFIEWIPKFDLDGTDPDDDAVACARMKARLIEWHGEHDFLNAGYEPTTFGSDTPWFCNDSMVGGICTATLEPIAVAKALVAAAEQRQKEGK